MHTQHFKSGLPAEKTELEGYFSEPVQEKERRWKKSGPFKTKVLRISDLLFDMGEVRSEFQIFYGKDRGRVGSVWKSRKWM